MPKKLLEQFYDDLVEKMKNEYNIDLTKSYDALRLSVVHYTLNPQNEAKADDFYETFAFIPQNDTEYTNGMDARNTEVKDLLPNIRVGMPPEEHLSALYNAALEGRLIVRPKEGHPFQIRVHENGTMDMGPEMSAEDPNFARMAFDYDRLEKPVKPGLGTRFLAFFHNTRAMAKMARYQTNLEIYNNAKADLAAMPLEERKFAASKYHILSAYMQSDIVNGEHEDRKEMFDTLYRTMKDAEIDGRSPGVMEQKKKIDAILAKRLTDNRMKIRKLADGDPTAKEEWRRQRHDLEIRDPKKNETPEEKEIRETITKELNDIVIDSVIISNAKMKIFTDYNNSSITKEEADEVLNQINMEGDAYKAKVNEMNEDPAHQIVINHVGGNTIRAIRDENAEGLLNCYADNHARQERYLAQQEEKRRQVEIPMEKKEEIEPMNLAKEEKAPVIVNEIK